MTMSMAYRPFFVCVVLAIPVALAFTTTTSFYKSRPPVTTRLYLDGKGVAGGSTQHFLGDVIRSLQPRYLGQVVSSIQGNVKGMKPINNITDELIQEIACKSGLPSWDELVEKQSVSQEEAPSARLNERLFGHGDNETPRVILYRDSAAWCPYCQKVWIALEEKRVSYQVKRVDMNCYAGSAKPTEFLKLQPSGNLPCAIVDGVLYSESDDIVNVIDSIGESCSLRPDGSQEWLTYLCDDGKYNSLERRLYMEWMWWLTGKRKPQEYKQRYLDVLDEVERALCRFDQGPYFLGANLSLAERQVASLAYFKGFQIRDVNQYPNICKWLEAMESRPSYMHTKSDYYTHSHALPPQLAAECQFQEPDCERLRDAIESMPIGTAKDEEEWIEPGWNVPVEEARREAAMRLVENHNAIVNFACRGAGTPGFPAASAPLADPKAVVNEKAIPAVDLLLRSIVDSLANDTMERSLLVAKMLVQATDDETRNAFADCLDYLRARIGVPRDMSYPAAHKLRNKSRWLASQLRTTVVAKEERMVAKLMKLENTTNSSLNML